MKITDYGCALILPNGSPIYYQVGLRGMIAAIKEAKKSNLECYVCNSTGLAFNEGATKLWPK